MVLSQDVWLKVTCFAFLGVSKFPNEEFSREAFSRVALNLTEVSDFNLEEVKQAVREMKRGKAVGPDKIPLEF